MYVFLKSIIFVIAFLITTAKPLKAFENSFNFKIHYDLEVIDTSKHQTHITAYFTDYPEKTSTIQLSAYFDAHKLIKLTNLSVKDKDDKNIDVKQKGNSYVIANDFNKDFIVSYDLFMNQYQKGPMGYLCDTYLLSSSYWTFILPEGITAGEYSVSFKLPDGWEAVAPWMKEGDRYKETNFIKFSQATYGAGNFEVREEDIDGTLVKIAVDKHFDKKKIESLFEKCFAIYRYIKSLFNTRLPSNHLTILVKAAEPNQWQFFNEASYSHGEALEKIPDACYQYSHRIFHTYNGFYPNGMAIEPTWFMEGTDEYYTSLSKIKALCGRPFEDLAYKYREVYLKNRDKYDNVLKGNTKFPDNWDKEHFLAYSKGALVSFLLDREIRKVSNNKKSLDNLLEALYKTYGQHRNGNITDETIRKTVNQIAGKDLSYFFDKYINGKNYIDMDNFFLDNDDDGICNAGEEFLGTDPDNFDTDGDSASDFIEYKANTDHLSSSSKPTEIIYIDGRDYEWSSLKTKELYDQKGDSNCGTDITKISYIKNQDFLYTLLQFNCKVLKDSTLRYYINIDLDNDYIAEIQAAGVYGASGDTSKFRKDWSNYDLKPMEEVEGLESAVSEAVEFKIPMNMLNNKSPFQASIGVWNTKTNKAEDNTPWLKFEFDY
jgi:predicted metalloprotease with PDZ domain